MHSRPSSVQPSMHSSENQDVYWTSRSRSSCKYFSSFDLLYPYQLIIYDMIWYDMIWHDMTWHDMIWYRNCLYDKYHHIMHQYRLIYIYKTTVRDHTRSYIPAPQRWFQHKVPTDLSTIGTAARGTRATTVPCQHLVGEGTNFGFKGPQTLLESFESMNRFLAAVRVSKMWILLAAKKKQNGQSSRQNGLPILVVSRHP